MVTLSESPWSLDLDESPWRKKSPLNFLTQGSPMLVWKRCQLKKAPNPIGPMGRVYFPTFTIQNVAFSKMYRPMSQAPWVICGFALGAKKHVTGASTCDWRCLAMHFLLNTGMPDTQPWCLIFHTVELRRQHGPHGLRGGMHIAHILAQSKASRPENHQPENGGSQLFFLG